MKNKFTIYWFATTLVFLALYLFKIWQYTYHPKVITEVKTETVEKIKYSPISNFCTEKGGEYSVETKIATNRGYGVSYFDKPFCTKDGVKYPWDTEENKFKMKVDKYLK